MVQKTIDITEEHDKLIQQKNEKELRKSYNNTVRAILTEFFQNQEGTP